MMLRALGFTLLAPLLFACSERPLEVAENVDLKRFQGTWYEIAKLPRVTQASCTGTTAYFELGSQDDLAVVNQCHEGSLDGPLKTVHARAVIPDASEPAKLSLDFGYAFGDFWILEVGENYEYALIGHPSRDYLWILSRTPSLAEDALSGLRARARALDFPVDRLNYTLQP